MSVLARDRKESKYEFYRNAVRIQRSIVFLLRHHFGVKTRTRTFPVDALTSKMTDTDKAMFKDVCDRNGITGLEGEYDLWLLDMLRELLFKDSTDLIRNVTDAFSIYPTNLAEYYAKRNHQNEAVCACERMIQDLEMAVDVLPIKVKKIISLVEQIDKEVRLIKGWRKADNKIKHKLDLKAHISLLDSS